MSINRTNCLSIQTISKIDEDGTERAKCFDSRIFEMTNKSNCIFKGFVNTFIEALYRLKKKSLRWIGVVEEIIPSPEFLNDNYIHHKYFRDLEESSLMKVSAV